MASINLGWIGDNWFPKPPKPSKAHLFACIGSNRNLSFPIADPPASASTTAASAPASSSAPVAASNDSPGIYSQMLEQFFWECEQRPDYRHTPEVERILAEDPCLEKKDNPTPEEVVENEQWWEEFNQSPVVKFLRRAELIADKINEIELEKNKYPYRREDRELWKKLPHVPGLDGRPMPRKSIRTKEESDEKFWDFARQFFLGLWGFRQRPYPPGRPIDVAQAIGYKRLEKRYYDCEFWFNFLDEYYILILIKNYSSIFSLRLRSMMLLNSVIKKTITIEILVINLSIWMYFQNLNNLR